MKYISKKQSTKVRPKTAKGLAMALNQNREIDQRTSQAKLIREIKLAIRGDLDEAARALLESDAAVCAVIQQMALKQAFSEPEKLVNEQGKACYAIGTWRKYGTLKKAALLALRKFQQKPEPDENETDLGSMVLEVTEEEGGTVKGTAPAPDLILALGSASNGSSASSELLMIIH